MEKTKSINTLKPLFSIIVPIYNAENTLEKCITSIIKQTYQKLEIILINDGSTDNSLSICTKFKENDARITILDQKNKGASMARNAGIDLAQGEFMVFVDSDDDIKESMLEKLYISLRQTKSDLVICGYNIHKVVNGKEVVIEISFTEKNYNDKIDNSDFMKLFQMPMLNQNWNKAYRADIIKSNKIYFKKELSLGEDLLFNLEILKHCKKISIISDKLYNFNCFNTNSLSKRYRENFFEIQQDLFHRMASFVKMYYGDDIELLIKEIENLFLQTMINYISVISRSKKIDYNKKHEIILEIVNDKEIHRISRKSITDNIKKRILLGLIRMKAVTLLIVLQKGRG